MDYCAPGHFPFAELALRPAGPADREFLLSLWAGPLPELQLAARERDYQRNFPGALLQIITAGGISVGILWTCRAPGEIRLLDLTLAPAYRGAGLGAHLLRHLLAEGLRVTLTVAAANTGAIRLYRRLGFKVIAKDEVHWRMAAGPFERAAP